MSRELFIYWRLPPQALEVAALAMQVWHAELRLRNPGLQTRLYRRTDAQHGHTTVMETYSMARSDDICDALHSAIVEQGAQIAAPWCLGARHVEVFEPLTP